MPDDSLLIGRRTCRCCPRPSTRCLMRPIYLVVTAGCSKLTALGRNCSVGPWHLERVAVRCFACRGADECRRLCPETRKRVEVEIQIGSEGQSSLSLIVEPLIEDTFQPTALVLPGTSPIFGELKPRQLPTSHSCQYRRPRPRDLCARCKRRSPGETSGPMLTD